MQWIILFQETQCQSYEHNQAAGKEVYQYKKFQTVPDGYDTKVGELRDEVYEMEEYCNHKIIWKDVNKITPL